MSQEEPLPLNADQTAVAVREAREILFSFKHLADEVEAGRVTEPLAKAVLSVCEHRFAKLGKLLGVPTQSEQDLQERHAELRHANIKVRALERQLGQQVTASTVKQALKVLAEKLTHWWRKNGLGHTAELHFTQYGHAHVKFSCTLFGDFRLTDSDTPVSDKSHRKTWEDELREFGFVLVDVDRHEPAIQDCDQSKQALARMIHATLPSAQIVSTTNHVAHRQKVLILRDVEVYIRDLDDLERLPAPAPETAD